MASEVEGYVVLTGIVEKEGSQFVSYCRELGTSSCGDTVGEAFENLGDAIEVHINALIETGELLQVFRERTIASNLSLRLMNWPSESPQGRFSPSINGRLPSLRRPRTGAI